MLDTGKRYDGGMQDNFNESAIHRAWVDTVHAQTTVKFMWLGGLIVAGIGVAIANTLVPENIGELQSGLYSILGALMSLAIAILAIFIMNFILAPYKQRNEARMAILGLQQQKNGNKGTLRLAIAKHIENANSIIFQLEVPKPPGTEDDYMHQINNWLFEVRQFIECEFPDFLSRFDSDSGVQSILVMAGPKWRSGFLNLVKARQVRLMELQDRIGS